MRQTEMFTMEGCNIKHESDAAVLVDKDGETHWIPFSQIDKIERHKDGTAVIIMTAWIAKMKGLI